MASVDIWILWKIFFVFNFSCISIHFPALCIHFIYISRVCLLLGSLVCLVTRLLAVLPCSDHFMYLFIFFTNKKKWLANCTLLLVTNKIATITGNWRSVLDTPFDVTLIISDKMERKKKLLLKPVIRTFSRKSKLYGQMVREWFVCRRWDYCKTCNLKPLSSRWMTQRVWQCVFSASTKLELMK